MKLNLCVSYSLLAFFFAYFAVDYGHIGCRRFIRNTRNNFVKLLVRMCDGILTIINTLHTILVKMTVHTQIYSNGKNNR